MPLRICVTGPDGCGKTTLVAGVVAALDARHGPRTAAHVQVWDSVEPLLTREVVKRYLGLIDHRSRALFLLHGVSRALALGEATGASVVVLDGYWYKYAVSELELGTPEAVFAGCAETFPRPDLTFYLDLPVEEAQRRKVSTTAYERGFASTDEAAAFVAFQRRLRARWATLEAEQGPWQHLAASRSPAELRDQVVAQVEALLGEAT